MAYRVKEIFYTLQGEGFHAGRAAVFCRFSGCNLWTGREQDRNEAACPFCDTDFVGTDGENGGEYADAMALAQAIRALFPTRDEKAVPYVVFTGGEPCLQLDEALIKAVKSQGFEVGIETNGTVDLPPGIDWVCVSPKAGTELNVRAGDELKLVWPQRGVVPETYESLDFRHFFLQPRDGLRGNEVLRAEAARQAVEYCLDHPRWKLSLQTHKYIGIQ